jgi:hypothetical protein
MLTKMESAARLTPRNRQLKMERETGIEPATLGLGSQCSTIELLAHDISNKMNQLAHHSIFTMLLQR